MDFRVRGIDLYITSSCNRQCGYCFLPDSYFASKAHMPAGMVGDILRWASGVGEVTVLGGEPASHPEFERILAVIAEFAVQVRLVTNGSGRFRRLLRSRRVRRTLHRVAVSLDSPSRAVVDRLRGSGAYADALATIDQLRWADIPYDINCTVVGSTLDTFVGMPAFAESLGADRLNVHWFSPVGRGRVHAVGESVSAADWRDRVLAPVARYRAQRGGFVVDCELAFAYGLPGEDRDMCAVRDRTNLQFFPNGDVFACGIAVEHDTFSGYVWRDGSLVARAGRSEVTETGHDCGRCPLREPVDGFLPVCVYNRLAPA